MTTTPIGREMIRSDIYFVIARLNSRSRYSHYHFI